MHWFMDLFAGESVASSVVVLCVVSALGMLIGSIRIFGITLGIAGVLFSGIAFGHYHITINSHVLEFMREFGLILFVYTIGMQVGPGFIASLRKHGLPLNLMAAGIVIMGAIIAILIGVWGKVPLAVAVGLFSGATTNTPSLGAAQQVIKDIPALGAEAAKMPGLGYAVAYPFGILGIIMTMGIIRKVFKVSLPEEQKAMDAAAKSKGSKELFVMNMELKKSEAAHRTVKETLLALGEAHDVLISRYYREGELKVPQPETVLELGDTLLAVGKEEDVRRLCANMGVESTKDLRTVQGPVVSKRVVVTQPKVLGKTPRDLDLSHRFGVTMTRVIRADMEFTPTADFRLQFGDRVVVVGHPASVAQITNKFGNSLKSLDHPQIIPVFVGIFLGVLLGSFPVYFPGAPAPVKLGLAGGPLLVAILLSRLGHFRSLVWYMPASANLMLRELGIVLFLSCVGVKAGDKFIPTLVQGDGFYWMACAALITAVPILITGFFARLVLKLNYMSICGLLSGSMTDPPALAFANQMTQSEAPAVAYATVYPLTMLMRIICAQVIVFVLLSLGHL